MGNKSGSYEELLDETKELLMKRTANHYIMLINLGMSQYDLELWYKAILDRSKKGKLSKEQMLAIYTEMSDLDPMRISEIVDSIEKIFDEDHSGSVDINEFMRGFILTTKGDLETKVEYTFRVYDKNGDNKISGDEIKKMANAILRMLGSDEKKIDGPSQAIVQQFLGQFTGGENGVIYKQDFIQTVLQNRELLAVLSPFYGTAD
ncbi:unnamed protein product [Rotaria socialis]|uniref:EF-hand domain-containing protein n=1 Tax=Rotaria socialis TaxID=392032 RepID=A0A820N2T7_9BILA|nr:unnamed protein product [Rotaria socialis]CAF4442074.1 unnamed protein product [Rotaria socialis]